jgi:hypothetical protein
MEGDVNYPNFLFYLFTHRNASLCMKSKSFLGYVEYYGRNPMLQLP